MEHITNSALSFPITTYQGELICTLQVESNFSSQANNQNIGKFNPAHARLAGFSMIDRIVLQILSIVMRLRIDSIIAIEQKNRMEAEVLESMKIAGIICNQRNKVQLIKEM